MKQKEKDEVSNSLREAQNQLELANNYLMAQVPPFQTTHLRARLVAKLEDIRTDMALLVAGFSTILAEDGNEHN